MSIFTKILKRAGDTSEVSVSKAIENHKRFREDAESRQLEHFSRQFKEHAIKNALSGSSIPPIHQHCRFDNYEIYDNNQVNALAFAKSYAERIGKDSYQPSFIFSGTCGTGKNHLSAAICLSVINNGGMAKMITLNELHQQFRSRCFGESPTMKETIFMENLAKLDLLVIDEVGLQSNSPAQKIFIDQVINDRANKALPTGMITNLDFEGFTRSVSARVLDRMQAYGGAWINFEWESYRTRKVNNNEH
ncbi:DNA replication protein DnaC [Photobacterium swingsii]|uniref:DNA replication protein DnaC n=1 Tax=Photobacterium swingsii TaxID=680026 RepID=A0A2T3P7A7_9GAMM|nr:ATP-binding protein [Photobacterium swingsii]PSW24542.1 DNA replication protein DnaC [Photobacterium swingsii]